MSSKCIRTAAVWLCWLPILTNSWMILPSQQQQQQQQQKPQQCKYKQTVSSAFSVTRTATVTTRLTAAAASSEDESEKRKKKKTTQRPPPIKKQPLSQPHNTTALERKIEKKIKVAKKQSEIDRILAGPDAPFDMEQEFKKVKSLSVTPPPTTTTQPSSSSSSSSSHETTDADATIAALEQDLYQAVKQQDYATAAACKKEMDQHQLDDCGAVLQVNARFYRAFSTKNYDAMQRVWLHDGTATCIHPSSPPLVGSKAVLESWKRMFAAAGAGAGGSFQRNWMEPHNIRLSIKGASTAIITCDELVYARRFVRGKKRQTELVNHLTATNIFRKIGSDEPQWYLCYHHASWHADSEAAKQALQTPLRGSSSSSSFLREDPSGEIGMDGILGIQKFGPLLGDEPNNNNSAGGKGSRGPVKRIVMGSLSDILEGGLGDLLSNNNNNNSNSNSNSNSDAQQDGVIHFRNMDDASLDDLDDDDDDDDDEMGDDDDEEDEGTVAIIKQWAESSEGSGGSSASSTSSSSSSNGIAGSGGGGAPKDALRQDCISALRKLCQQGTISPKQKRVLLTDIISCSARGEFSMVEVAYELLCGEGDDKDAAEEEFADQCRVFAQALPESPSAS